jgi:hypothetical protein
MTPAASFTFLILLSLALPAAAQQLVSALETLPSGIARLSGKDTSSGIAYTRLFLTNAAPPPPHIAGSLPTPIPDADLTLPTLTVQCTQSPNSKFRFELFVNFGGITDPAFYPPWRPTPTEHFAPSTEKVTLIMEFLGYTKVKPVKHQFEMVPQPSGQLRYNSPGMGSNNLEEIAFYFKYLRALPTFHLTSPTHTATFATAALLAQIHTEPLCAASGL